MRSEIPVVLLLVIVSCLQESNVLAFRAAPGLKPLRPGNPGPPGPRGDLGTLGSTKSKLPYCPVDQNTAAFLKKIRRNPLVIKTDRIKGHPGDIGPRGPRGIAKGQLALFPFYNCHHVALNWAIETYVEDAYICCDDCRNKFNNCTTSPNQTPITTSDLCPSEAIHCVSDCLCKLKQPGKHGGQKGQPGRPGPPGQGGSGGKRICKEEKSRTASCIKRSCIPII